MGRVLKEAAEYEVHGKDGKIHYVEVLSAPHYSGKEIIGFQGIARGITARKQTEESLREAEEQIRLVTNNMQDLVVLHGFAGADLICQPIP